MAKSGLKVKVKTNIKKNTQKAMDMYESNAVDYLTRVVNQFSNEIKMAMQPPKSGELYEVNGKTAQRSARGESPAIDSGRLVNSIFPKYPTTAQLFGSVETSVWYAFKLEKMMDRPIMGEDSIAYKNTRKYMKAISEQMSIKGRFKPTTFSGDS